MAELRKHRELSEILFGLVLEGEIEPTDLDGNLLTYPYNAAIEDRVKGENKSGLMLKYGTEAIQAATMAAKACEDGIAPEEWLRQLARVYQDFKVVNVMHKITKKIERDQDVDLGELKDVIDGRLSELDTEPLSWADVKGEFDQEWLWSGWIPHGEMSMLVGHQGSGKSAFALYLADCMANGAALPDGSYVGETKGVLWVETEGRQAENIRRARVWGVDPRNIYSPTQDLRRVLDINQPDDRALIRAHAMKPEVGLVVIDSLGGSLMEENDSKAKILLQKMAQMAQETDTTFIVIHHLRKTQKYSKGHQPPTLADVRGHGGITQFSPSVLCIDYEGNEMPRFLYALKMNLVELPATITFTIGTLGLLFNESAGDQVKRAVVQEAVNWLEDLLQGRAVPIKDVMTLAKEENYEKAILKQAINFPSIRIVSEDGERCLSL